MIAAPRAASSARSQFGSLGVRTDQLGIAHDGTERVDHVVPHRRGEMPQFLEPFSLIGSVSVPPVMVVSTLLSDPHSPSESRYRTIEATRIMISRVRGEECPHPDPASQGRRQELLPDPISRPNDPPGSANDPRLHPVGEVADIAAIAEFGVQDQDLAAGQVDVDGLSARHDRSRGRT